MTSANRSLIAVIAAIVAVGAFWLIALGPKRDKANELDKQVQTAKADVAKQQQAVAEGEQARRSFPGDYQQLVLLGKAVPEGEDSGSLLVQLSQVADRARVQFRKLDLSASADAATPVAAPPAPGAPTTTAPVGGEGTDTATPTGPEASGTTDTGTTDASTATTATATVAAPPTEAGAATLPIGASVGAAGLGVMPYELQFTGSFFQIADFLQGLDKLVETTNGHVAVDGRLMTVDGFSLTQDPSKGFPALQVNLFVTTYVTPAGQGLTAGATATAPAPTATTATTTSATTTTP